MNYKRRGECRGVILRTTCILVLSFLSSAVAEAGDEDLSGSAADTPVVPPKSQDPPPLAFPPNVKDALNKFFHNGSSLTDSLVQYPSNITDAFKGRWEFGERNVTSSDLMYRESTGVIFFHLFAKKAAPKEGETDEDRDSSETKADYHEVEAEMLMRDGVYPSQHDIRASMHGVYMWKTGQLFLFSELFHEVVSVVDKYQHNFTAVIDEAAIKAVLETLKQTSVSSTAVGSDGEQVVLRGSLHPNQKCMFQLFLQMQPVRFEFKGDGAEDFPKKDQLPTEFSGVMVSPNCLSGNGILLNATAVLFEQYYHKAINYCFMVTFISFVEVLLLIRQMEFTNTQSSASKVSLITIGQQAIMDSYLCLLHLTTGIVVERLFNAFATAAFFKFVIFAIFEMRYLLTIWKARRPQQFNEGWMTMRRELSMLYSRFYGFLLFGIILMYQMQHRLKYMVFILYSFWVPQIVHNVQRDSRRALHTYYILGMTCTRLAIPLYFYVCPYNFLHIEPQRLLGGWLCAYMGLQVGVLLMQNFLGPRFFIPAKFLPEKYNYYRPHSGRPGECVICMQLIEDSDRMITPCDHMFHPQCLLQWMDIKMECPTCRRVLPQV